MKQKLSFTNLTLFRSLLVIVTCSVFGVSPDLCKNVAPKFTFLDENLINGDKHFPSKDTWYVGPLSTERVNIQFFSSYFLQHRKLRIEVVLFPGLTSPLWGFKDTKPPSFVMAHLNERAYLPGLKI